MKTNALDNVIDRQRKRLVRDALAVVVLVMGLFLATLAVALHSPAMAPFLDRSIDDAPTHVSPTQATTDELASRPDRVL